MPEVPLIDRRRLDDLRRGLPDGAFEDLALQCLDEMRGRVPSLVEALQHADGHAVHGHAHALAGMAGNYGMVAFAARMGNAISVGQAGSVEAMQRMAPAIVPAFQASASALCAHLSDRAA